LVGQNQGIHRRDLGKHCAKLVGAVHCRGSMR
jgi:hypothetical protein